MTHKATANYGCFTVYICTVASVGLLLYGCYSVSQLQLRLHLYNSYTHLATGSSRGRLRGHVTTAILSLAQQASLQLHQALVDLSTEVGQVGYR